MLYFYIGLILILVIALASTFTVKQQTAVVVERLGKFMSVRSAGLNFKLPELTPNRALSICVFNNSM